MKTRITDQGLVLPRHLFDGVDEVEVQVEKGVVTVTPLSPDPIQTLGANPVSDDIRDGSENHDAYLSQT
jgi:hypothetical protein